jgi:hypothetical protein
MRRCVSLLTERRTAVGSIAIDRWSTSGTYQSPWLAAAGDRRDRLRSRLSLGVRRAGNRVGCTPWFDNPFSFLGWIFHRPPRCVDELRSVVLGVESVHGVICEVTPEGRLVLLVDYLECPIFLLFLQEVPICVKRFNACLLENHPSPVFLVKRLVDLPGLHELLRHLALHWAHLFFHPLHLLFHIAR